MLREIDSLLSFLTIIPSKGASLEDTARCMHLFPVVGMIIGAVLGLIGFGLLEIGAEPLIMALAVVMAAAVITGLHHADGLCDFADGLLRKGTRGQKLAAMKDSVTGTGGIFATVLYIGGMLAALSYVPAWDIFAAVFAAEIAAKFSMVLLAAISGAATRGSSVPFLSAMRNKKKIAFAGGITFFPIVLVGGTAGMAALGAVIAVTMIISAVSARSFGGITGDVMGAANEISRLTVILVFLL